MTNPSTHKIWSRDFLFVFLTQIAFSSAYCTLIPTLPIYFSHVGSSEVQIGVLIGALGITSLVVRPFVGKALLKHAEKAFMVTGILLFALGSLGYVFAFSFWLLLMVRIIQGIGSALLFTAGVTWVANASPETRLGQSLSYYYLAFNVGFAVTPTFGMFLMNAYGFTVLFVTCAAITLCSLGLTTKLRRKPISLPGKINPKEGSLLSRKAIPTSVMALVNSMTWGAVTAFFPLYALTHGVSNPGLFFSVFALMIVSGRALGGRIIDLHSRERVILPSLAVATAAMIILVFSKTLPLFVLVAMVWGLGHAFLFPALAAYTLERTGSSPGPAMATFSAFDELGMGLGSVVAGIILRLSSYPVMFLCLALLGILNIVYFFFFVKKRESKGL